MEFIDPRTTPFIRPHSRGELPHLYKPGGCYFVTFRLCDAIDVKDRPRSSRPRRFDYYSIDPDEFLAEHEPPLALGSCVLEQPSVAKILQNQLIKTHKSQCLLAAWCIMPNHAHVVCTPLAGCRLDRLLQSWKGGSAFQINKLLRRQGTLWERESFDHLIRSPESFEHFVAYVERNPVAAGLCATPQQWKFSSAGYEGELWCRL